MEPRTLLPERSADGIWRYRDSIVYSSVEGDYVAFAWTTRHSSCLSRHATPEEAARWLGEHGYGPAQGNPRTGGDDE